MKIKQIRPYELDYVPDHIAEEYARVKNKLIKAGGEALSGEDPNLALSSSIEFLALMLVFYISEDPKEIRNAVGSTARVFIKTVERLSGVQIIDLDKNP